MRVQLQRLPLTPLGPFSFDQVVDAVWQEHAAIRPAHAGRGLEFLAQATQLLDFAHQQPLYDAFDVALWPALGPFDHVNRRAKRYVVWTQCPCQSFARHGTNDTFNLQLRDLVLQHMVTGQDALSERPRDGRAFSALDSLGALVSHTRER